MKIQRWLKLSLVALAAGTVLIQLVPYGRAHTNPSILAEPNWDIPQTRELARRACFDCHSNEVVWPWYAHVAPVSWLVQRDVDRARKHLNFSTWTRPQEEAGEAADQLREGEMPLGPYLWLHPDARLDASEKAALVRGLEATLGSKSKGKADTEPDEDDDEG